MQNYGQVYAQPFIPPMPINPITWSPALGVLWPQQTLPLGEQEDRYHGTWLDASRFTQLELDVQNDIVPYAAEHNARQMAGEFNHPRQGNNVTLANYCF